MKAALALVPCLVVLPSPLGAQATGLPLRNAGVGTGISFAVDVGWARVGHDAPADDDKAWALGGTVTAGLGPLGAALTLARTEIDRATGTSNHTTATGSAALQVFGGPLVPLSVRWQAAGAVRLDGPSRPWRASLGVGATLAIPIPVLSIRPWLAPRIDYFGGQADGDTSFKGALAAGVDFRLLNGLGIRFAYDSRVGWDVPNDAPSGVSLGLSYAFR